MISYNKRGIDKDTYKLLTTVPKLKYKQVPTKIWETIKFEGLDVEKRAYHKKDWKYALLPIPKKDSNKLKLFDAYIIEKYNLFDILLKEKFNMKYIDLIDYDNGKIIIVYNLNIKKDIIEFLD